VIEGELMDKKRKPDITRYIDNHIVRVYFLEDIEEQTLPIVKIMLASSFSKKIIPPKNLSQFACCRF
jgi:hypothetical protein